MKVLLTTINSQFIHTNLAIRILYTLNKNFKHLDWYEFVKKDDNNKIASYCANYDIVAFSCYIWNINQILEIIPIIKKINPQCKILLGGPEVSYDWQNLIIQETIDFIIIGEGEISFTAFLNSYPQIKKVPGLIWKENNFIHQNETDDNIDLAILQGINPYNYDLSGSLQNKICYIETSRGCPYNCSFCLAALQKQVRYWPQKTFFKNLKYLMEHGKMIKFLDRTFNCNTKHAIQIFDFIIKERKPWNIFQFEIKADQPQPEIIDFIKKNVPKGIFRFEIGIQTLNPKANTAINRNQNFENIKNFIRQISDIVEIHIDLIVGLPYDYYNDIRASFNEVFQIFAPELQLGMLKFLKGTSIRKNSAQYNYQFNHQAPYQILESDFLTNAEIEKISNLEEVLNIFWNRKRAIFSLKYTAIKYSIFDFLIELGIYFQTNYKNNKINITDIFDCLFEFAQKQYCNDLILQELIAIDYYLYCKIKPNKIYTKELPTQQKNEIIKQRKLNLHKYRYLIIPIHFDFKKFQNKNEIELKNNILILQYSGTKKPDIIDFQNE